MLGTLATSDTGMKSRSTEYGALLFKCGITVSIPAVAMNRV